MAAKGLGLGLAALLAGSGPVFSGEPLSLLADLSPDASYRRLVFVGTEIARANFSLYFGERRALGGRLDKTGKFLELGGATGVYAYEPGTRLPGQVVGFVEMASASLGFQKVWPRAGGAVLIGAVMERHRLKPFDPGNPVNGTRGGVRLGLEAWARPLPKLIVAGAATASNAHRAWRAEARLGWQITENLRAGPEVAVAGNREYTMLRAGFRLEGIRFAKYDWAVSAGAATKPEEEDEPVGAYGTLSCQRRF